MWLKTEKLVHHADQESSWLNIGIDIIVDPATLLLKWTHKPLKRTNKSWKRKKLPNKPKEKPNKKKPPIKLQLEKVKKTPKKLKRNDFDFCIEKILLSLLNIHSFIYYVNLFYIKKTMYIKIKKIILTPAHQNLWVFEDHRWSPQIN